MYLLVIRFQFLECQKSTIQIHYNHSKTTSGITFHIALVQSFWRKTQTMELQEICSLQTVALERGGSFEEVVRWTN